MGLTLAISLTMVAAGCSDGDDLSDGGTVTDGTIATGTDDTQDSDSTDTSDDAQGDDDDVGSSTSAPAGSDDGAADQAFPGQCGIDEVNRQPFYSVANIQDDDPDGGLNVRDNYENGEKIVTLPEGSVVFAEDCFKRDDGAIWYFVETTVGEGGWVNAAFLSAQISSLEPTFGGTETEEKVIRLLDALAAKRWEDAADELTLGDTEIMPLASLLGAPGNARAADQDQDEDEDEDAENAPALDLADLLAAYCNVRVCDGPYTVTAVRGSYLPSRVSPEVDVTFTYSGGIVMQTFGQRGASDDEFSLDTLPGQSILAFKRNPESVTDLAGSTEGMPSGLLEAAEMVRRGLLAESGHPIPDDFVPTEGVVISTNAYVDPNPELRQVITAQDIALNGDVERIWGYTDGVGSPIVATVDDHMATYRRSVALLQPDVIGVDTKVGQSNTIDNLAASFPDAHIVEFHRKGRGELLDFNWSSVRLALELRDRQWVVVAVVGDNWTI